MHFTPATANEADVVALTECLAATVVGETCTYTDLSRAVGRDIRKARHLALRAMQRLNEEQGVLFSSVYRVGYKRLLPAETHKVGSTVRAKMRRVARRTAKVIANAVDKGNDMPAADRRRAMAEIGAMNMMAHLMTERITHALPPADKPRTLADNLAGLLEHIGAKPRAL